MLAIKVGTPSYLELYMKREREKRRGIDRDKDGDRDKEDENCNLYNYSLEAKQTYYNYLDRPIARCVIQPKCHQPL